MDKIRVKGGRTLKGSIQISGAKNAALPLMATCLLTDETVTLQNTPLLSDVRSMMELLAQFGVDVNLNESSKTVSFNAKGLTNTTAPYDLVRKMRASVLVLGPLVGRHGEAHVSLPGGCAIGTRPIDLHIKGLQALGAEIELGEGYIHAKAPQGLHGADFTFSVVSVTGTENLMMAATLAKGKTRLINAAREPEIVDLANCLNGMGAKITGMGTDTITIEGVEKLHGYTHRILPDRIELGTYAIAAAITHGDILLEGGDINLIPSFASMLEQSGVKLTQKENGLQVTSLNGKNVGVDIMTEPFPGFATDLQAQAMSLMCTAEGASMITESIFENRFMHVPELCRMGANITVHGSSALVRGVPHLIGAPVMATDLRASVSLVLAGLVAQGETIINRVYHLDRGYEGLEEKLSNCGAEIERMAA